MIRGDWAQGTFEVLGKFEQKLSELTADKRKLSTMDRLTEGQKEALEWLAVAIKQWKCRDGATVQQVASVQTHPRKPTRNESETTRKQLKALHRDGLISTTQNAYPTRYFFNSDNLP